MCKCHTSASKGHLQETDKYIPLKSYASPLRGYAYSQKMKWMLSYNIPILWTEGRKWAVFFWTKSCRFGGGGVTHCVTWEKNLKETLSIQCMTTVLHACFIPSVLKTCHAIETDMPICNMSENVHTYIDNSSNVKRLAYSFTLLTRLYSWVMLILYKD